MVVSCDTSLFLFEEIQFRTDEYGRIPEFAGGLRLPNVPSLKATGIVEGVDPHYFSLPL